MHPAAAAAPPARRVTSVLVRHGARAPHAFLPRPGQTSSVQLLERPTWGNCEGVGATLQCRAWGLHCNCAFETGRAAGTCARTRPPAASRTLSSGQVMPMAASLKAVAVVLARVALRAPVRASFPVLSACSHLAVLHVLSHQYWVRGDKACTSAKHANMVCRTCMQLASLSCAAGPARIKPDVNSDVD